MQKFFKKPMLCFASHFTGARWRSVLEIAKMLFPDMVLVKATFHCLVLMKTLIFKKDKSLIRIDNDLRGIVSLQFLK
jgi:hypothetical protein